MMKRFVGNCGRIFHENEVPCYPALEDDFCTSCDLNANEIQEEELDEEEES